MAFRLGFGLRPVKSGHQAIVSQFLWPGLAWPELARLGLACWPEAGPSTSLMMKAVGGLVEWRKYCCKSRRCLEEKMNRYICRGFSSNIYTSTLLLKGDNGRV